MWCPMVSLSLSLSLSLTPARMHAHTHIYISKKPATSNFYSEDAADTVLQNTGIYLPHLTVTSQKTKFFKIMTT